MNGVGRALAAGLALLLAVPLAAAPGVQPVADLAALGERARSERVPILLVVSRSDCPYCKLLREEVLDPMLLGGEYAGRILIRELFLDSFAPVRDFEGEAVAPQDLAGRYSAGFTPTVLFLDHRGRELVDPLIGINTLEYYGYYLDAAIAKAHARLGED